MNSPEQSPIRRDDREVAAKLTLEAFYEGHITARDLTMDQQFVYLLRSGTAFKIGKSNNPEARLKTLLTGSPTDIAIVVVLHVDNMHKVEAFLHQRFAAQRLRGEWFSLTPDDVFFIQSLDHAKLIELGLQSTGDEFPF